MGVFTFVEFLWPKNRPSLVLATCGNGCAKRRQNLLSRYNISVPKHGWLTGKRANVLANVICGTSMRVALFGTVHSVCLATHRAHLGAAAVVA